MAKKINNVEDLLIFLQFNPNNNNDIIIMSSLVYEYIENKNYDEYNYITVEKILKLNNYKYNYGYCENGVAYSCYIPLLLNY